MDNAPLCPVTGQPMVRDVRPLRLTYKGHSITVPMPGWYSARCEESVHTGEDMKVSDEALKGLRIRAENLLGPVEIRRIRKRLRLTQAEAGRLVGGGPRAFQKYEAGTVLASRGISNLLRVLDRHPEEVERLRSEAGD